MKKKNKKMLETGGIPAENREGNAQEKETSYPVPKILWKTCCFRYLK